MVEKYGFFEVVTLIQRLSTVSRFPRISAAYGSDPASWHRSHWTANVRSPHLKADSHIFVVFGPMLGARVIEGRAKMFANYRVGFDLRRPDVLLIIAGITLGMIAGLAL